MPSIIDQLATRNPFSGGRSPVSAMQTPTANGTYAPTYEAPQAPPPTREQNVQQSTQQGLIRRLANGLDKFGNELLLPTNGFGKAGAYLAAASGAPLGLASMAAMKDQREGMLADAENEYRAAQIADMARKANLPKIETVGGILGTVDQNNGAFTPTFTAPRPEERYAAALGYNPGSPEWNTALQDYTLRSSGPTAYGYDEDLEGVRQDNRERLEGIRQTNRSSLKGQPTYSQTHPRPKLSPIGGIPPRGAGVVNVTTPAEALRLPSGTKFRIPGGQIKVRP